MIETRDCPRFTDEALHSFRIGSDVGGQQFDSDRTVQLARVLGKVHLAHPTRADMSADLVTPEFCSFTKWHCCRAPPWSAAAWRRFGLDQARSRTKRRQAAALQRGA